MIAAVVLAAGAASRFGAPKQQLLLPMVLERLRASPVDSIVVVAGAHPVDAPGAGIVQCPEWARGPGASLRRGLAQLGPEVEAAVVCLADGPNLAPAAVERVLAAWRDGAGPVVAASYEGHRGHPLDVERSAWDGVPDAGLRPLPAALVPCDDVSPPGDVDRADDIGRLQPPVAES